MMLLIIVADITITHMTHCPHVTVHHHTVQKMPYRLVVTSTLQTELILSTHLGIDLMAALMLRCALFRSSNLLLVLRFFS